MNANSYLVVKHVRTYAVCNYNLLDIPVSRVGYLTVALKSSVQGGGDGVMMLESRKSVVILGYNNSTHIIHINH